MILTMAAMIFGAWSCSEDPQQILPVEKDKSVESNRKAVTEWLPYYFIPTGQACCGTLHAWNRHNIHAPGNVSRFSAAITNESDVYDIIVAAWNNSDANANNIVPHYGFGTYGHLTQQDPNNSARYLHHVRFLGNVGTGSNGRNTRVLRIVWEEQWDTVSQQYIWTLITAYPVTSYPTIPHNH